MSVYDILDKITSGGTGNGYAARMLHPIPKVESVNRRDWIYSHIKGKRVLDIGSAGTNGKGDVFLEMRNQMAAAMDSSVLGEGAEVPLYGIDSESCELPNVARMDLDKPIAVMPWMEKGIDTIIAGEVLEHMCNPGVFLENMRQYNCELVLTVPNAFSSAAISSVSKGTESVNRDHTCWFSWRTLSTLLEKCDYSVKDWMWYGGSPLVAEGLIFVTEGTSRPDHES